MVTVKEKQLGGITILDKDGYSVVTNSGARLSDVADPVDGYDATNKNYVDSVVSGNISNISEILTEGNDATGLAILNIGNSDGYNIYLTDANITTYIESNVSNSSSLTHTAPQRIAVGFERTTWLVTIENASGDSWSFDWRTRVQWKAIEDGYSRLSAPIDDTGEMEGSPPDVTISSDVINDEIRLTVENNSGGDLKIRIGETSIIEKPISGE